jgi:dihydroorotate dehydrogenase (fumarate)
MANLKTKLCGMELDSPFVLASGPAGWDAESLAGCAKAGAGAVVTKSLLINGSVNDSRHMMYNGPSSLLNNEGGSDMPLKRWIEYEIPKAKDLGIKNLIVSVNGYVPLEEALAVSAAAEKAGADMLEIVGGYAEPGELVDFISAVKRETKVPLIAKVNGNWKNTDTIAAACAQAGADGITAIDSIGPAFRVDINTGRPLLGRDGYAYLTGAPILPIALRFVRDIALKSDKNIIGTGGVHSAESALEMLMAGASACGVCSAAILRGPGIFAELNEKLSALMDKLGYADIPSVSGLALRTEKPKSCRPEDFRFNAVPCTRCKRCVTSCAYRARSFRGGEMTIDPAVCRVCGLCIGVCPTGAITLV